MIIDIFFHVVFLILTIYESICLILFNKLGNQCLSQQKQKYPDCFGYISLPNCET